MPKSGFVSIILPVYNAAPFVAATMQSMLDQTHREFEIIAIDDGSTDASLAVLEELARGDSRIRVFTKPNGGSSSATNFGLAYAEGEFVSRMDADDLSYRTRIADEIDVLSRSDDIALCSTEVDYTFHPGRVFAGARRPRSPGEIRVENIFGTFHIHPTVVFDMRKLDRAALRYDESYPVAEDFELLSRIDLEHPTAILPEPRLLVRRQGHGSLSTRLSHKNPGHHFRVTMRQLAAAGIAAADPQILDLLSSREAVEKGRLETVVPWLTQVRAYGGYRGLEQEAYQRGLGNFTNNVVDALYGRAATPALRQILTRSGLDSHVSSFDRMRFSLGAGGARGIDRVSGALRQVRRYWKSKPASSLSDQLGPEAIKGF